MATRLTRDTVAEERSEARRLEGWPEARCALPPFETLAPLVPQGEVIVRRHRRTGVPEERSAAERLEGWRREGPRDYHPPRPDRAPRQEPRPPSPPTGSTPPPTPGGWGPSQHAPRHGVPQMDVPRAPSEPPSRFRPPPSGGMRGENGNGQGRGPENRFGGRQ